MLFNVLWRFLMEENRKTFIRAREIALKYGMGVSTVWKWTAIGHLPKPQS